MFIGTGGFGLERRRSISQTFFQVETRALLDVQLSSSDDNPGVAVGVAPHSKRAQESRGYVEGNSVTRAVLPGANFEPLPSVMSFEETGLVLAHNSLASPNVSSSQVALLDRDRPLTPDFRAAETLLHSYPG